MSNSQTSHAPELGWEGLNLLSLTFAKRFLAWSVVVVCLCVSSCAPKAAPNHAATASLSHPLATATFSPVSPLSTLTVLLSATSTPVLSETVPLVSPVLAEKTETPAATNTPPVRSTPTAHPLLIAFTLIEKGEERIYTINPDGSGLRPLLPGETSSCDPRWSPDGRKIAFLTGRICKFPHHSFEDAQTAVLNILDYETGQLQQVDFAGVSTFTWSPDGQSLAFSTDLNIENPSNSLDYYVYLVSIADLKVSPLHKMPTTKRIVNLSWSPMGDQILARWHYLRNTVQYLHLFSSSGEDKGNVDPQSVFAYDACWDPAGERIVFVGDKLPEWTAEMWIVSADGAAPARRIIRSQDSDQHIRAVSWSPDGKSLAYSNGGEGGLGGIFVIDLDTETIDQIVPPEISVYALNWSADSNYLAFLALTEDSTVKGYSLDVYSFATGRVTQIVSEMVGGSKPVWRP